MVLLSSTKEAAQQDRRRLQVRRHAPGKEQRPRPRACGRRWRSGQYPDVDVTADGKPEQIS